MCVYIYIYIYIYMYRCEIRSQRPQIEHDVRVNAIVEAILRYRCVGNGSRIYNVVISLSLYTYIYIYT